MDHSGDEWTEDDYTPSGSSLPVAPVNPNGQSLRLNLGSSASLFFVYTEECFYTRQDGDCSIASAGQMAFNTSTPSFIPHGEDKKVAWPLSKRIVNAAKGRYLLKLYIMCGPCVCALRTAFEICSKEKKKYNNVEPYVRVDDRIRTRCCETPKRLLKLESLLHTMKMMDSISNTDTGNLSDEYHGFMDRIWLEKRIYSLEEEAALPPKTPTDRAIELLEELRSVPAPYEDKDQTTAHVILGEVETCHEMMRMAPFPPVSKMPKETEIYQLITEGPRSSTWERKYLGTYTPIDYHLR